MTDELISPKEAARMLGVTTTSLVNWEKSEKLTACRTPGGHRRYKLAEIMKLKEANVPQKN